MTKIEIENKINLLKKSLKENHFNLTSDNILINKYFCEFTLILSEMLLIIKES